MMHSPVYLIMAAVSVLFPFAVVTLLVLIYITLRNIENKMGGLPK